MEKSNTYSIPVSEEAAAGAAIYSKFLLALYDIEVLMFELPVIFKCPLKKLKDLYSELITSNHLDIGVGTGYFLDKCRFPEENPNIHLMDLNSNSLEKTAKRISHINRHPTNGTSLNPLAKRFQYSPLSVPVTFCIVFRALCWTKRSFLRT